MLHTPGAAQSVFVNVHSALRPDTVLFCYPENPHIQPIHSTFLYILITAHVFPTFLAYLYPEGCILGI